MEANTKALCKSQLEKLANSFVEKDGKDLSLIILETCSSLLGIVGMNTPASSLSESEVSELIRYYTVMRCVMSAFVNDAANQIDTKKLNEEIESLDAEYKRREKEYNDAAEERLKRTEEISAIEANINGIYATNDTLLRKYKDVVEQLEKLKKLASEYSEESLVSAEQECERLTEETKALQERQGVINVHTEECLGQITEILTNIKSKVVVESANVNAVCKEADALRMSIAALTKVYNEYEGWFNVLKTPAQQLEEDIGKPEMEELRNCLDESKLKRKHEIVKQTEENLKYLERLVASCALAAQKDQHNILLKAGK